MYLVNVNEDFLIYNNKTSYITISFNLFSPGNHYKSIFFPTINRQLYCTISLISSPSNTSIILDNSTISLSNDLEPILMFYVVKNEKKQQLSMNRQDQDISEVEKYNEHQHYLKLKISSNDKMFLYVDIYNKSKNLIFETDLIRIFRHNPYVNLFYRKVTSEDLSYWIANDQLVESFCFDDENSLHSIYKIEHSEIAKETSLPSTYFKKQALEIIDMIFQESLIMTDVKISSFYYK